MVPRPLIAALTSALTLAEAPAAVLLGPRQVAKTILALALTNARPPVHLVLESSGN